MKHYFWVILVMGVSATSWAEPPTTPEPPVEAVDASPEDALRAAQQAFREGDFASLRRLLEPLLYPTPRFATSDDRVEARQLLGLGLYFDAQQVTDADERRTFLDLARQNFLDLLLERPDFALDPLLYPASVVELFESVRAANSEELERLLAEQRGANQGSGVETIYVERNVTRRNPVLSYFPFGIGQFQNGQAVKGTLFAVGQGLALGLNITSYLMVESLRGDDGFYDPGPDRRSGDYQDALTWKNVMYGSAAAFVALWAGSVLDAVLNFEEYDVRIRALDAPPPELMPAGQRSGSSLSLPLGWSLSYSF